MHLKIICLFVKFSLIAAMQKNVSKITITAMEFTIEDRYLI